MKEKVTRARRTAVAVSTLALLAAMLVTFGYELAACKNTSPSTVALSRESACAAARARVNGILFAMRPATVEAGRSAAQELSYWVDYCDGQPQGDTLRGALLLGAAPEFMPQVRAELVRFQKGGAP